MTDDAIAPPRAPGSILKNRYRVVENFPASIIPRTYRVQDYYVPGREFFAGEYPVPFVSSTTWEQIVRGVDEESRQLSWLQSPGIILPRDIFTEQHCVFVVDGTAEGQPLDDYIKSRRATVRRAARWTLEVCDLYKPLHGAFPRPIVLGKLSAACLVMSREGRLQLSGFRLDDSFKLCFATPRGHEAWSAPEGAVDARSDVWCLGKLLEHLLAETEQEAERPRGLGRFARSRHSRHARHEELRAVIERATDKEPALRHASMSAFKRELHGVARQIKSEPRLAERSSRYLQQMPLVAFVLPYVLATLLISMLAWGIHQVDATLDRLAAGLHHTPLVEAAMLPSGTEIWTEGRIETVPRSGGDAELTSPLGGAPCVGYDAWLERDVRREIWDPQEKAYRVVIKRQVLLQRSRCLPFDLVSARTRVAVEPGAIEVTGSALVVSTLPPHAVLAPLGRRRSDAPAAALEIPRLRVGETVLSVHGREGRIIAGERVYIRARVEQENGNAVLKSPAPGALIVYRGTWAGYVTHVLQACAPGLACVAAALGIMVAGASRWRRRRRAVGVANHG